MAGLASVRHAGKAPAWDGHSGEVWADIQQGMLKHVPIPLTNLLAWLSYLRPRTQAVSFL
jgi:hypothetical protein